LRDCAIDQSGDLSISRFNRVQPGAASTRRGVSRIGELASVDHLTYDAVALPFETTRWSLVLAAAGNDSQAAREALSSLCQTYWYPLYAYLRRRGLDPEDARDLTQGFLTSLIERQDFEGLRQDRGRFRAFLLASLKHYLSNWSARERTQKRGGGWQIVPLENAEGLYVVEPVNHETPETLFERRWALTVVDCLLGDLRAQWTAQGRASEFDELKACLLGQAPAGGYAAVAARLETSEGAVKAAVHRLRRQFQSMLRQRVAETVADGRDVDDEIRHLIQALSA
jgi:DNA-directed RNA polymerase specialized sigma24 family protein